MKPCRPIGIWDSGLGGLTVMQQIVKLLPNESLIYYGDTARLPYGAKSRETIIRFSIDNTIYLMEKEVKMVIVACNTASALALEKLQQLFSIPIIGTIQSGVQAALNATKSGRIGIIGTKGTIQSTVYQRAIIAKLPSATVIPIACPLLVPLVEEHFLNHAATELIIKEYLDPLKEHDIDTLLLGCTHYPLIKKLIQKEIGDHINVVDSATTCANEVAQAIENQGLSNKGTAQITHQFYVSDDPERFGKAGGYFLGHPIEKVALSS